MALMLSSMPKESTIPSMPMMPLMPLMPPSAANVFDPNFVQRFFNTNAQRNHPNDTFDFIHNLEEKKHERSLSSSPKDEREMKHFVGCSLNSAPAVCDGKVSDCKCTHLGGSYTQEYVYEEEKQKNQTCMSNKESDEQPMDDSGKKSYGQPLDLAWSKSRSDKHSSDAANGDNITSNAPSSGSARPETSFDPVAELLSNVKKAPRRREIGRNPRIPFTTPQVRQVKKKHHRR